MSNYIDGFALPVPTKHLEEYKQVSAAVAKIIIEHGALSYHEFVADNTNMDGVRSFANLVEAKEEEAVLFGWIEFETKEARDKVNQLTASDPRMKALVDPLTKPDRLIFDASRMVYGGFESFVEAN